MKRPRIRALLLADTHLGFDLPARPRIERRRRGPEFFEATRRALAPARRGEVDLVIHGGDLLYRSRVPRWLVQQAMEPFHEVADLGVPVYLVPGNHERSRIPYPLLVAHPLIHIFDRPRTYELEVGGARLALSGWPFAREVGGAGFARLLEATQWQRRRADLRLLCLHQAVEGATVGVQDYTFRRGDEVIAGRALKPGFAAVLCGHIHRAQVLTRDLGGRPLAAPVIYPGAIQRTSFAERREVKGFCRLELVPGDGGGRLARHQFIALPSRPMIRLELAEADLGEEALAARLEALPRDAIVKIHLRGGPREPPRIRATTLRALARPTMNVELAWPRGARR